MEAFISSENAIEDRQDINEKYYRLVHSAEYGKRLRLMIRYSVSFPSRYFTTRTQDFGEFIYRLDRFIPDEIRSLRSIDRIREHIDGISKDLDSNEEYEEIKYNNINMMKFDLYQMTLDIINAFDTEQFEETFESNKSFIKRMAIILAVRHIQKIISIYRTPLRGAWDTRNLVIEDLLFDQPGSSIIDSTLRGDFCPMWLHVDTRLEMEQEYKQDETRRVMIEAHKRGELLDCAIDSDVSDCPYYSDYSY
jgi:hypothetical protein